MISVILIFSNILQSTLLSGIRIRGISPNFNIIIIVSFALLRGSKEGSIIGFFAGLIMDIFFSTSRGYLAIIGAAIGYFCGKFNKDFYRENLILPFMLTLTGTLVYGLGESLPFLLRGKINYLYFIKNIIIPETIYTITLSIVLYQILYMINEKIEKSENTNRKIF